MLTGDSEEGGIFYKNIFSERKMTFNLRVLSMKSERLEIMQGIWNLFWIRKEQKFLEILREQGWDVAREKSFCGLSDVSISSLNWYIHIIDQQFFWKKRKTVGLFWTSSLISRFVFQMITLFLVKILWRGARVVGATRDWTWDSTVTLKRVVRDKSLIKQTWKK